MSFALPSLIWDVSPTFVALPGFSLRYYGALFTASLYAGYGLLSWQIRRGGGDAEEAADFWVYGMPLLMIGARLGHVLFYDAWLLGDPVHALNMTQGGMASHGAGLGLALAMYLFTRRRAIPFLEGADRLTFSVAVAAILIRIGNLFNSEIVGKPTDGSWGIAFPRFDVEHHLAPLRHPTQIYEMLLGASVFALLLACDARWGREHRPRGALTGALLVSYFCGRFLVEFWKEPQAGELGWLLNMGQMLSIPYALLGVGLLWWSLRVRHSAGWVVAWKSRT